MADKDFELEDPFQPTAVAIATPGYDGMEAMARCFVEEFALMGWPPAKIFRLFTVEEFAGSYSVLKERGPEYIRALIEEVFGEALVEEQAGADREVIRFVPVNRRPDASKREGEGDARSL